MPDDVMMALATTLATKGAEAAIASGKGALAALVRLVRDRFGRGTPEGAVLQAAVDLPEDAGRRAELAALLGQVLRRDPVFNAQVQAAWRAAAAEVRGGDGVVLNHFSGTADKVVQARDISGGVTF